MADNGKGKAATPKKDHAGRNRLLLALAFGFVTYTLAVTA